MESSIHFERDGLGSAWSAQNDLFARRRNGQFQGRRFSRRLNGREEEASDQEDEKETGQEKPASRTHSAFAPELGTGSHTPPYWAKCPLRQRRKASVSARMKLVLRRPNPLIS